MQKTRKAMVPARLPGVTQDQWRRTSGPTWNVSAKLRSTIRKTADHRTAVATHATAPPGSRPSTRRICGQATIATSDPSRQAAWRSVMAIAVSRSFTNDRVSLTP
jgi:hypothetical protein